MSRGDWQAVIGLEVHVQLNTRSKLFSTASTRFGAPPNSQADPVDLGLPGVLPVINEAAVRKAVTFGLAIGAQVNRRSVFDRKNYFYPDLPKGYQISQFQQPIVGTGALSITLDDGTERSVEITRAHLEEDAGKSVHDVYAGKTGVDLNRAGTPLLEVVSEPVLHSAEEAAAYFRQLHSLVRYLDICDGDLSQGNMRCDANVSVRPRSSDTLGERTEIKNINSFRFVAEAVALEIERQIDVLESGGRIVQETRQYDADAKETRSMRTKEDSDDYRYFPDPDLMPLELSEAFIEEVAAALPELPQARRTRYVDQFGLSEQDALLLTGERAVADYFDAVVDGCDQPKLAANWLNGDVAAALNRHQLEFAALPVPASELARLITRIGDGTISSKIAKGLFEDLWNGEGGTDELIERKGLKQVDDQDELAALVASVLRDNADQVAQYRGQADPGKRKKMLGYFVGQLMKATKGKANPRRANELLRDALES